MRRKYLLMAAVVWLVLIGMGLYWYNKPHTSAANVKADFFMQANALYEQFQQDEPAANKKYLDKIIEVTGIVVDSQQENGKASIELRDSAAAGGINCSFMNLEKNERIPSRGSLVTIKGKCSGFLMDVNLVDCAFKE